jgi:hypothetical protein
MARVVVSTVAQAATATWRWTKIRGLKGLGFCVA